jgi:hypothetical protein
LNNKYLVAIFLVLSLLLSACSTDVNPKEHLVEIYSTAFDAMMENDTALNSKAKFISVDMNNLSDLTEQNKQDILRYFKEKYKIETMNASFEELKEKGMYNPDTGSLDGVLLRIEKVDFVNNHEILIEGSKYRSGLGAFGCKLIVHFESDVWKVKEFITTRES